MLGLLNMLSKLLDPTELSTLRWAVECKAFSLQIPFLPATNASLIYFTWRIPTSFSFDFSGFCRSAVEVFVCLGCGTV
jgi:hypothetical protein